jgi:hypothetical protein
MITKIRLSQIKDTYNGNEDVLIPMVKLLEESPSKIEFVVVFRSPEWVQELQVYEPFPISSYLVKAYKLAFPSNKEQSRIYVNALEYDEPYGADIRDHQQKILIESSKLKVLISKGDKFIAAYANNILKAEKLVSQLSQFSQLVNDAEVSNDSK